MKVPHKQHRKKKQPRGALDSLTFMTGILLPLLTIPQAYVVLVVGETAGVSLWTWSFYLFASLLFAIYGAIHRQKLLIYTYFPFTFIEAAIVLGLIIH